MWNKFIFSKVKGPPQKLVWNSHFVSRCMWCVSLYMIMFLRSNLFLDFGFLCSTCLVVTPVAGSIFWVENRAIFSERFFGRGIFGRSITCIQLVPSNWLWRGFINHWVVRTIFYEGISLRKKLSDKIARFSTQKIDPSTSQYRDYGFVRAKRQRNVASKRIYLRNFWKVPCRGSDLWLSDIVGFAKKTKKNTYRVTKT